VDSLEELITETAARQRVIDEAITDYMSRTKNKNLVIPDFPSPPKLSTETHTEPQFRALNVANYVGSVWSCWLWTEEQRVRRASEPRTGKSPWIMPEELSAAEFEPFPMAFSVRVKPEPLRQC